MSFDSRPLFVAHPWHGISSWAKTPSFVNAYIEIVPTDGIKYELDKESGYLRVDRPQRYSSFCPALYGFIPQTYCGPRVGERCSERTGQSPIEGDRDPLDICVLTERVIPMGGFLASARPIGGLRMVDGNEADDKIVAILEGDLLYGNLRDLHEAPTSILERLEHYFLSYKQMPGATHRRVTIAERYDAAEALEVIRRSVEDYRNQFRGV